MGKTRLIGVTFPSGFSGAIHSMVTSEFNAIPIILNHDKPSHLTYLLNRVQGIVFAGGCDICPTSFGAELLNGMDMTKFDVARDEREIQIFEWAQKHSMPIFGICRGHQMLARLHKLPFLYNINGSDVCHNPSNAQPKIEIDEPIHYVTVKETFQQKFFVREMVNSYHHQAIKYLPSLDYAGNGVEVIGTSTINFGDQEKGIPPLHNVELMQGVDGSWLSCQWHPEAGFGVADEIVKNAFYKMLKSA